MQSRSVLLTTFGSFGDIHPFMALALELKRRGHKVLIGTSELYRDKIESIGIDFVPVAPDLPSPDSSKEANALYAKVMDPNLGTQVVLKDIVLANVEDSYRDIYNAAVANKCDLIIAHALTYSSVLVAEKLGIPWVFTALQPIIMFSAQDASVPPMMQWVVGLRKLGPKIYRTLMDQGSAGFAEWARPIYDLRGKLGLPTNIPNPILGGHFSPHLNLAMFSKYFAPPAADWPENTVQTGFPFYDNHDASQKPMSRELKAFLDDGEPPIVFTLGTAAVRDAGNFYHTSLEVARELKKRSVLLVGIRSGNGDGLDLGPDTIAVDYAPFSDVFPKACLNVHQGGVGTTSQALRSGKPMLVMPYGHDQPDNAARCARLGVGRSIERRNYCAPKVANLISNLLSDPATLTRAERIGAAVKEEHGPQCSADAVEKLLQ